ncbi:MAG TPA: hypothetical protein VJC16_01035, partial [Candidatus Nanoarchaeia archaeon]|nr:hypothetical protein [Candidatus Nanoarchaeia archaeon]
QLLLFYLNVSEIALRTPAMLQLGASKRFPSMLKNTPRPSSEMPRISECARMSETKMVSEHTQKSMIFDESLISDIGRVFLTLWSKKEEKQKNKRKTRHQCAIRRS